MSRHCTDLEALQVEALIQLTCGWGGEGCLSVYPLRDTLLVADSTGVEGGNGLVAVQVSTPDLHMPHAMLVHAQKDADTDGWLQQSMKRTQTSGSCISFVTLNCAFLPVSFRHRSTCMNVPCQITQLNQVGRKSQSLQNAACQFCLVYIVL